MKKLVKESLVESRTTEKDIKLVLNIMVNFDDGWYGTNTRYIYAGPDNKGFNTKGAARKYATMFKKYIKSEFKHKRNVHAVGKLSIDNFNDFETYRYCGAGPSWSCSNNFIDHTEFMQFVEKETERLERGREDRERFTSRRKMRSENIK